MHSRNSAPRTVLTYEASSDICKLAHGVPRVSVALAVLEEEPLREEELSRFQWLVRRKVARLGLHEIIRSRGLATLYRVARAILGTLVVSKRRECTLTIPGQISDLEALVALNAYFRKLYPALGRGAVYAEDLEWLGALESVVKRDIQKSRMIVIEPLVSGTRGKSYNQQMSTLKRRKLSPADPLEQVLVAATYACLNGGSDIFQRQWVRGSLEETVVIGTSSDGITVMKLAPKSAVKTAMSGAPVKSTC